MAVHRMPTQDFKEAVVTRPLYFKIDHALVAELGLFKEENIMTDQERIAELEQEAVDLKAERDGLRRYAASCEPLAKVLEAARNLIAVPNPFGLFVHLVELRDAVNRVDGDEPLCSNCDDLQGHAPYDGCRG